jgi:SAM-dependent methyltransferase
MMQTWEREAEHWVKWARTPGHDIFPYFAPAFFDEIVPPPHRLTLEIGCGEGRVARELVSRDHSVVAVDASPTLVRYAREADARSAYLLGNATALPFADATFDTVIAYNSLQTMAALNDMPAAIREAGRVLKPSGYLCFCTAHPITDIARLAEPSPNGDLVISGSYFEHDYVNDTVTQNGLTITFTGWTHTLEDYARALEDAGFVMETLREPRPTEEQLAERPSLERWRRLPLFLWVRAVRR